MNNSLLTFGFCPVTLSFVNLILRTQATALRRGEEKFIFSSQHSHCSYNKRLWKLQLRIFFGCSAKAKAKAGAGNLRRKSEAILCLEGQSF